MRVIIKQHPGTGLWVSNDGRVILPPDGHRFFKFRFTYGHKNSRGYLQVMYHGKAYLVHRLVAQTYLDNPLNLPTVDHINRVKTANFVENLRFGSYKLQADNTRKVNSSLAKFGVRKCDDPNAYYRAYQRERRANPEFSEQRRAYMREWRAKQKATS